MSCKPKTKSLRAANGVPGTVHMLNGGDLLSLRSHKEPLLDPAAEQNKVLASMQDSGGGADQGQPLMQQLMQSGSSGAPGAAGGLFETGQAMRQTMNQGMSNASALQRGLGTSTGTVPTGGALGPPKQDPRMSGAPSGMLAMAEGGEVSPYSIKGIGRSMGFFKSPDEQRAAAVAKIDAEQAAYRARQAPLPAAHQAPAQGGISGYAGNSTLDGRMKAAGLRDGGDLRTGYGGDVPGTGQGDKIPAKYEPGEFVVSNDMLDAQPELLGHLRGLRKAVLAAKGTTPEQADAQALGGRGLRAHA